MAGLKTVSTEELQAELAARQRVEAEARHQAETERRAEARTVYEPLYGLLNDGALATNIEAIEQAAEAIRSHDWELANMVTQSTQLFLRAKGRMQRRWDDTAPPPPLEDVPVP